MSSKSVNSGSSLGEVTSHPQVLTECDSCGINIHSDLGGDRYVGFFVVKREYSFKRKTPEKCVVQR